MKKNLLILGLALISTVALAQTRNFSILAPATKGGGYDTLAQNLAKTLNTTGITTNSTVYNIPGDGGVKGLQEFIKGRGDATQLVIFGLTTIGAMNTVKNAGVTLKDLTPIAKLVNDYEVIVVTPDSPIKTAGDVVSAYKRNPSIRFGGASEASAGQLFLASVLKAGGGNLKASGMKWVSSSGNLQAIKAMQQKELDIASVSLGVALDQIKAGTVRAVAISSPEALVGVNIPTVRSQGIEADLINWRGVFAPAGLDSKDKARIASDFSKLSRSPAWREALATEKQTSAYQPGLTFGYFLDREAPRIRAVLQDLNLAN